MARQHRTARFAAIAGGALILAAMLSPHSTRAADTNMADAVNRKVLRVCATRANLPYSNEQGEGFENKIAQIIADEIKLPIDYTFFPQGRGFVELTLNEKLCDVVIGAMQTDDQMLNTNHYFRSTYCVVYRSGQGLDGVSSLFDPRLKDKRVGIQAGVFVADQVAKAGLMANAKPYRLFVDTRYDNPMQDMVADIRSGEIDLGVLWGPYAGYFASRGGEQLTVAPMLEEVAHMPRLEHRVTMGVRRSDSGWKRQLNTIIAKRNDDIKRVLHAYGVPMIDEDNKIIAAPAR
jgi:quinoprotein dehydrogenase-associated probable ABC transporter substrate-binding protein